MAGESWLRFAVAVLATWRVTHLLGSEDGPANVVRRVRESLQRSGLWRVLGCFNCLSVWVAAPFAVVVAHRPADLVVTWLALSGGACLLQRLGRQPVVFEQLDEGEISDGMLRTDQ